MAEHNDLAGDAKRPHMPAASVSRRRLIRAGIGAAPVVMTLVSRPVTAATCVQASSFASALLTTSHDLTQVSPCDGRMPEWWAWEATQAQWPAGVDLSKVKFLELFGSNYGANNGSGETLLAILKLPGCTGREGLARNLIASWLNVRTGRTSTQVLDDSILLSLWNSCQGGGFYVPTAGIKWYTDESVPEAAGGGVNPWLLSMMS